MSLGGTALSDPSPHRPLGCCLLGSVPHCLDSCRTWSKEELGKRSGIERFFGRVFLFFHLQRPPLCGWSEIASQVALTYAASVIVGLAAKQAGRPDLIRSPKRVLAHLWGVDSQL